MISRLRGEEAREGGSSRQLSTCTFGPRTDLKLRVIFIIKLEDGQPLSVEPMQLYAAGDFLALIGKIELFFGVIATPHRGT